MVKKLINIAVCLLTMASCSQNDIEQELEYGKVYTRKVTCDASQTVARAYDADLNWSWEASDALIGYQVAGRNLRNTLNYIETASNFVCEAFQYMSTDPESFHFIYPAAAEVTPGTLVAVQDGKWRPVSVTTISHATIEALGTLSFQALSAAFELRIFAEDKTTPVKVAAASLTAEIDFVGKWVLQNDMSYLQSLEGKEIAINGLNNDVVVFNMPDLPEGVAADELTLTLTNAEGETMTRSLPAMTFVKGKRTVLNVVFTPDSTDEPDTPINPDPEGPETITGTFTCASYNVDGLPEKILGFIDLNGDGPGTEGTKSISQKIATSGWDIVTFQENFSYNDELVSGMKSVYTFGTHRKFSLLSALGTADTDGLGFATLNATCSFTHESWWAFNAKEGGLTEGANTSIKKGIRHYVVSMKNNPDVLIDVLVTHMNTADSDAQITAQNNQLTEVANYINSIRSNNRPIIFMGDMNTRYTRNDYATYFWNKLDSDLTYADPWVEHSWDGVYPTLGSASLMIPSKDNASTLTEQTGEVVDKIIYINNPNADTQIYSNWYNHDESYAGMADHKPVVAEFRYEKQK